MFNETFHFLELKIVVNNQTAEEAEEHQENDGHWQGDHQGHVVPQSGQDLRLSLGVFRPLQPLLTVLAWRTEAADLYVADEERRGALTSHDWAPILMWDILTSRHGG